MAVTASAQTVFRIADVAHIDAARRAIVRHAGTYAADENVLGRLTLIVQEMGRNLVNHARGGELLYSQDSMQLQLLAVDRGPGMTNVAQCLADNYSTAGTMGAGLGGIRRLADRFDIHSQPGKGTVVLAQIALPSPAAPAFTVGGVCTALAGEEFCGDSWALHGRRLLVADGLGHGHFAHQASGRACDVFLQHDAQHPLADVVEQLHRALASTRGAAAAIVDIDPVQGQVHFCGVGNIAGMLINGGSRSMVSGNGTLGYKMGRARAFSYPWDRSTLLIMASDGVSLKFDVGVYPGLKMRHPAVIAAVLHRDFKRVNDDATVVVVKHE